MSAATRPVHDPELYQFHKVVREAYGRGWTCADFLVPVSDEHEVSVYCLNPGGLPGKRYSYRQGWIEEFQQDLATGVFLNS